MHAYMHTGNDQNGRKPKRPTRMSKFVPSFKIRKNSQIFFQILKIRKMRILERWVKVSQTILQQAHDEDDDNE